MELENRMNQIPLCGLFALEEALDLLQDRICDEERKEGRKTESKKQRKNEEKKEGRNN